MDTRVILNIDLSGLAVPSSNDVLNILRAIADNGVGSFKENHDIVDANGFVHGTWEVKT